MEQKESPINDKCCLGCLSSKEDIILHSYEVQNQALKLMFQSTRLSLCYVCKRLAQHAEAFIQSVQSNQILLANFGDTIDSTFQTIRKQAQPIIKLQCCKHEEILVPFPDYDICIEMEIKPEIKEEGYTSDHIEADFVNDCDEFQISMVKEDDDVPLIELLKREVKVENEDLNCLLPVKKKRVKKKIKELQTSNSDNNGIKKWKGPKIRHVNISREQCMEERARKQQDKKYVNFLYKCEHCIKGFCHKYSYEEHMEKHSKTNGDYECDICKQRMPTDEKLQNHKKSHLVRYKCSECSYMCVTWLTVKDHFMAVHCPGYNQYNCPHCPKVFTSEACLRKHIWYAHKNKERVTCAYCHKTYVNKDGLKTHIMLKHPRKHSKDEVAGEVKRRYVCEECGKGFRAPSLLRTHSFKHSGTKDFYCVECDKSFKSDAVLQQHLKTTLRHINYLELPLPCSHCDKRFAIKRDLERHTNRIHLKIKPYQCDKCEKAYVNACDLRQHKRLTHEGFKRPLKYPCPMCDKIFNRNQILKSHIRTHTGERPFECSKCPAKFSQANMLSTHVKLIHLRQTRDGRPKRNQILKSHIRTHTGERPYECSKCPAKFSQANMLSTHVKLIHLGQTRDGRPKAQAM